MHRLNTKIVVQGANIPITHAAEVILHQQGVLYIPDFIANAGGVICAAMEYQNASEMTVLSTIEDKLRHNTREVLETARQEQISPRDAALLMARKRVEKAMGYRRWRIF